MIKRFKFLVIILVLSIYSVINCSDFPRRLGDAIRSHNRVDFSKLTLKQKVCYLPQIHKKESEWMPISLACYLGNFSAIKWLLSNGAVVDKKCFEGVILGNNPQSKVALELLKLGVYHEYIGEKSTLQTLKDKYDEYYSLRLSSGHDSYQYKLLRMCEETENIIRLYESTYGRAKISVISAGDSYAGAGSGVVVSGDCVKREE